jgi:hypothetical protein
VVMFLNIQYRMKQDRQHMYTVSLWHVWITTVAMDMQQCILFTLLNFICCFQEHKILKVLTHVAEPCIIVNNIKSIECRHRNASGSSFGIVVRVQNILYCSTQCRRDHTLDFCDRFLWKCRIWNFVKIHVFVYCTLIQNARNGQL